MLVFLQKLSCFFIVTTDRERFLSAKFFQKAPKNYRAFSLGFAMLESYFDFLSEFLLTDRIDKKLAHQEFFQPRGIFFTRG